MIWVDKLSAKPVYEQLVESVETHILLGVYPAGSFLPSVRELSVTLSINPNTIQKAYAELTRRGEIRPSPGNGSFVTPDAAARIREAALGRLDEVRTLCASLLLSGVTEEELIGAVREAARERAAGGRQVNDIDTQGGQEP